MADVRRLNWAWSVVAAGWENSDVADHGQQHVGDVLDGLPYPDDHFDYVVANHSLQCLEHRRVGAALAEPAASPGPAAAARCWCRTSCARSGSSRTTTRTTSPTGGSLDRRFSMYRPGARRIARRSPASTCAS